MIIPYFGKLPNYFDLWLESVRHNLDYNFLIITDEEIENNLPENVRVIKSSFEDLVKKIQSLYPFKISLKSPYKLCDYRPAYGEIFKEELVKYDFWGYCDVDLIFGSINHFTVHQQARRCGGYNPFNDYYIRKAVTEISVTAFFKN